MTTRRQMLQMVVGTAAVGVAVGWPAIAVHQMLAERQQVRERITKEIYEILSRNILERRTIKVDCDQLDRELLDFAVRTPDAAMTLISPCDRSRLIQLYFKSGDYPDASEKLEWDVRWGSASAFAIQIDGSLTKLMWWLPVAGFPVDI